MILTARKHYALAVLQLPQAPYFLSRRKEHYIDLCDTVQTRQRVSHLALLDDFDSDSIAYDSKGLAWSFHFEQPPARSALLGRLLAHTIYNPVREVAISWSQLRDYSLEELRDAYLDAVAHDKGILTQFVEPNELQQRIQQIRTFEDLVEIWQWMSTDHDT